MKSGIGGVGVGVGAAVAVATLAIPMKRSLRIPFSLLFLVAVATVLSCRSAVRRCLTYQPLDNPRPALVPPWNTTLLRLASVDANEMAERSEIEGLLDSAGFGYDGESTHRSIVSWRRFHRLDDGRRVSRSGDGGRDPARLWMNPAGFSQLFPEFRRALRRWSRNRRFDPGVMSELVNLVKRPIDLHRGGVPPSNQTQRRYGSCAVVGNSGILLKHDHGGLIDSHDFVIRLNNARTNGYDRNVGSKTSLAFVNSNILHLCARREGCFCHPYGAYVPMIMYLCQPVHFLDYIICNVSYMAPLLITDARFDMMCSRIVKYYSLKRFIDGTGKSPGEWYKVHDAKMFHYSSGMQAVMLAVGICDQVSIFGFGKSTEEKHHYHTNQKAELDLHDYEAEYALYRDLIERSQVMPFLADSGFKVPSVVMYR